MFLLAEVVITLADFVTEDRVRKPLGGVYAGERVTHAVMGLAYGAVLAMIIPILWRWWSMPSGLVADPADLPVCFRYLMILMAIGVSASGFRDLLASLELHHAQQLRLAIF